VRRIAETALVLVLAAPGVPPDAADGPPRDDPVLEELRVDAGEHDLLVSFHVSGAFTPEIREAIESGLTVTFRHDIEVVRRRLLWFDRTLVRKTVTTTVTYDTMTHQYSLARGVNDEVAETSVAINEDDMMRWMTRLERIRLTDPSALGIEPDDALYVRVKSLLQRRFVLLFIPSNTGTGWEKVGVSLPEGAAHAR
jgi:hypothetical protein